MTFTHDLSESLQEGAECIRAFAKDLPALPGVYRMINSRGDILYVGKAKRLKRRVLNYTHINKLPMRLKRMVSETVQLEVVITHTEVEALLLESNLIKKLKPRYNILLRDDKSFPYLYLDMTHAYPRLQKHRGARKGAGTYYGPFASGGAVNKTMTILQKAFLLRNCSDHDFENRTRPCLQYHIKRCSAPCVGHVSEHEYAEQVADMKPFLDGRSNAVKKKFQEEMSRASDAQDYEAAAMFRDRIRSLSALQTQQDINLEGLGDVDVIAFYQEGGQSCIQIFFFRGGQNFGNRSYFPRHSEEDSPSDIVSGFLAQFYENKPVPRKILVNQKVTDTDLLVAALSSRAGGQVVLSVPQKGSGKRAIDFAYQNALQALQRRLASRMKDQKHLESLEHLFGMSHCPARIEIYDNSHVSGTNMVGAMVVSTIDGFQKSAYRQFSIREAAASDDYGMMREVMTRRFRNARPGDEGFPDVLLIDGGRGQLSAVSDVLKDLGIYDALTVVAISKGPDRNAGREEFHINDRTSFTLPVNDPVLHYLQVLRDEAHRFAIGSHRKKREKSALRSSLDSIDGVGAKKKRALLHYFGSVDAVKNAGVEDLKNVEGISSKIAEKIYYVFHDDT